KVAQLHPILLRWLHYKEPTLVKQAVARIAIVCEIEDVLEIALFHSKESVRFLVVQDIFLLWHHNPDLTKRLLTKLSKQFGLFKLKRNLDFLDTLIRCSLILIMDEYTFDSSESKTIPLIQSVWRPVIQRVLLVSRIKPLEKFMMQVRRQAARLA